MQLRAATQRVPNCDRRNEQVPLIVPKPGLQHDGAQQLENQGCFTEVDLKLGYHFVLHSGAFSRTVKPGGGFLINR